MQMKTMRYQVILPYLLKLEKDNRIRPTRSPLMILARRFLKCKLSNHNKVVRTNLLMHFLWFMLYGRSVTPTDFKGKGVNDGSSVKISQNFIEGIKEQMREEMREEMRKQIEEHMAAYKSSLQSSVQQQFLSMISQLQGLVPGMNNNQVPTFNLNFGSPGDTNSAQQTQAIRARNVSSASSYEPQGQ
ncbi:Glycosyl hydrolase all-beta protein [Dioscorea alata]|uniref:Glycosyl hydrolase all-beta protein n=1 Tax=Dioscorea alata TaxID=55571 RepID=A0ACB7VEK6_DIOAL|nr:Glycosyl hydrolase all-beta protein [Dioscorea alata]